ncbi:MAG: hypothetical protein Kow00121_03880 [Elainellaceae cyanobacterium]
MAPNTFLKVDEQIISLDQALQYLQSSGRLEAFIRDILREFILEQELQARALTVAPDTVTQIINHFREQHQLLEPDLFQEWLANNGLNKEIFYRQIEAQVQLEQFVTEVTEPRLQQTFVDRKLFLDQIILSRIVVDTQELAEELYSQIQEEGGRFEELARHHSIASDRVMGGIMGAISRGQLPDEVRSAIDMAKPDDVLGPMLINGRWCLFKVEAVQPASLADQQLRQSLREELFEQWLIEKLQTKQVELYLAA